MSTDRAVAARAAANTLVPDSQNVAFATGVTAATVPAHVNEVYVSVADDVAGVLTVSPRAPFSQLLVHIGSISTSGALSVSYGELLVLTADTNINSFDCILVSTGSQMVVQTSLMTLRKYAETVLDS